MWDGLFNIKKGFSRDAGEASSAGKVSGAGDR